MSNTGSKSKLVAGLLCWFLGVCGAHRYYYGYKKSAIVMTILMVLGFLLILPLFVVAVWSLIDFVRILTGGLKPNGLRMSIDIAKAKVHELFADADAGITVLDKYYSLYRKGAVCKRDYEETAAEFLARM